MKEVIIYTDGGCRGNQSENNIGAYAYHLDYNGHTKDFAKAVKNTTNNIMELTAAIESLKALKALKQSCNVKLHSDSAYMVNAINQNWLKGWKKNGWRRKVGKKFQPLANCELWQELDRLINIHNVKFIKVKGHSDCELNNHVDMLLNDAMDQIK